MLPAASLGHWFSEYYTLWVVAIGSATLGVVSGGLGTFAVLRKQSLLGDAISHAALPGIALAFLFTRSKEPVVLMLGAAVAGWLGTLFVLAVVRTTRIKEDSALGLMLSVFFGLGLLFLTYLQKNVPDAGQAGLDRYLFGQAAAILERDIWLMAALGAVAILLVVLFWKEFKLLSFDPEFGASLGFPMRTLDVLLVSLLVIAIVIGLQTVGVVLMSAMVVAPAAAARQWTDRLHRMVLLSALFGALAGVGGALISSRISKMPTGPTIVLCLSALVVFSLLFAYQRGLVWDWIHQQRNRKRLAIEAVLADLYVLATQHEDPNHAHSIAVLRTMRREQGSLTRTLHELEARGWATRKGSDAWSLTAAGRAEAQRLQQLREAQA